MSLSPNPAEPRSPGHKVPGHATYPGANLFGLPGVRSGCPKIDLGGQARAADPLTTLRNIRPCFHQAGLTRLGNITYLDRHDIPVTIAVRPNSKSLAVSSGKSMDLDGALVSGAMEALELYAAEEASPTTIFCPYDALESARIPLPLLPFRKMSIFSPSRPERWCSGWDLMNQQEVAVPFECVTMDLCFSPMAEVMSCFRTDSNGLASGNYPLEAICSGLVEVIERDSVTLRKYAGRLGSSTPAVKLDSLSSPRLRDILRRADAGGLDLFLYDCTSDTRVPVYQAFCCDREPPRMVSEGYGAHLDPAVAAERALLEALQGRTIIIAGARDDVFAVFYEMTKLKNAREFLRWTESHPPTEELREESLATSSFEGDIEVVLGLLRGAGVNQAIAVDLTPKDWPIAVFRILVPGLEGYYPSNREGPRAEAFLDKLRSQLPSLPAQANNGVLHFPAGGTQ